MASLIQRGLQADSLEVDVVHTGEDALEHLTASHYDAVVLDIMLPGINGLEVVRELRRRKQDTPVLALTARGGLDDRIEGLDAGCDDYLPKPFAFEELQARLRALLRRSTAARMAALAYADLTVDPATRAATRAGKRIELTNKEYTLLEYLMRNPERVLTRAELLEQVWGYDFETPSNVLEVYMNFLRKKVDAKSDRKLLQTVRGVGYMLKEGPA